MQERVIVFLFKNDDFVNVFSSQDSVQIQQSLNDVDVDSPFKTNIKGISFKGDFKYEIQPPNSWWNEIPFKSSADNLEISIDEVRTNDIVVTRRGNITLRTRVNATCRNIKITATTPQLGISGGIQLTNRSGFIRPNLNLRNLNLIDRNAWTIESRHCTGFKDFRQELNSALLDWLTDKSEIQPMMQQELQGELKSNIKTELATALKKQELELPLSGKLTILPYYLRLLPNGQDFALHGIAFSQFASSKSTYRHLPFRVDLGDLNNFGNSGMFISKAFLTHLSNQFQSNGVYQIDFESQKIDGLRELHDSRFAQFFVFPDLMNFDRTANFIMKTFLVDQPKIQFSTTENGEFRLRAQGKAIMDNYVPKDKSYVHQTRFNSNYTVEAKIYVSDQKLNVDIQEPNMSLEYTWNQNYIDNYDPNTNISEDRIKSEISKVIEALSFSVDLPEINLSEGYSIQSQAIENHEGFVFVNYQKPSLQSRPSGRR